MPKYYDEYPRLIGNTWETAMEAKGHDVTSHLQERGTCHECEAIEWQLEMARESETAFFDGRVKLQVLFGEIAVDRFHELRKPPKNLERWASKNDGEANTYEFNTIEEAECFIGGIQAGQGYEDFIAFRKWFKEEA